jgi:hypothetical protein
MHIATIDTITDAYLDARYGKADEAAFDHLRKAIGFMH